MFQLDPSSLNELGRSILDPALEARLIARGIVYARRRPSADGKRTVLTTSRRPLSVAIAGARQHGIEMIRTVPVTTRAGRASRPAVNRP